MNDDKNTRALMALPVVARETETSTKPTALAFSASDGTGSIVPGSQLKAFGIVGCVFRPTLTEVGT